MKALFTDTFVNLIDQLLVDHYDKPISKKDYLTFFDSFERGIAQNTSTSFDSLEINDNEKRKKWGRVKYEGKMVWKLTCILNTLKEKRIIECTGYLPEKHSRRYSYTLAFSNALDFSNVEVIYEDVNEKMYDSLKNCKSYDESNPQYILLKSDRFSIDETKCLSWLIDSYKAENISKVSCLLNIRRVHDIASKDIYVVRIPNGRVYTSFNSLKRELRKYCYIDGKPLASLDLKSSQPYLLASYLYSKYPNVDDVKTFYEIVTEGDVYEWAMQNINSTGDRIIDRDECKVEFFRYMFKKTNNSHCLIQSLIERELPMLYDLIKAERNSMRESGNTLTNYLQATEADIFIPVCESFPNDCLSVHDSLYFSSGFEMNVKSELESRFSSKCLSGFKLINN